MICCGIVLCLILASTANAAERPVAVRAGCHRAAVRVDAAPLAVVPFAVPVAVPVALLSQPAVFYARRAEIITEPRVTVESIGSQAPQAADAVEVLRTRCAACHTGERSKGELPLFTDDGAIVERLPRRAILDAVVERRMPKGAAPLTEEELELIRDWAEPPRELLY